MSINWNRFTYKVNIDFFKTWSPAMAYILGFAFADGCVYKTTLSFDLKKDKGLLDKINQAMGSSYPIHECKASFRLRISNPIVTEDLQALGVKPNKSKVMKFPAIPFRYFSHFARGYFDGDGWIYTRHSRNEVSLGFSSGSQQFLKKLSDQLVGHLELTSNNLRTRNKVSKRGIKSRVYQVDYFCRNAYRILLYLYSGLKNEDLYMKRKYKKYQEAVEVYEWVKSGGKQWRKMEKSLNKPMKQILSELWEKGYNGPQIADKLGVHHSSIYRWLIKTNVRPAFSEIRRKGIVDE